MGENTLPVMVPVAGKAQAWQVNSLEKEMVNHELGSVTVVMDWKPKSVEFALSC